MNTRWRIPNNCEHGIGVGIVERRKIAGVESIRYEALNGRGVHLEAVLGACRWTARSQLFHTTLGMRGGGFSTMLQYEYYIAAINLVKHIFVMRRLKG